LLVWRNRDAGEAYKMLGLLEEISAGIYDYALG
jgi:hypothetical protein